MKVIMVYDVFGWAWHNKAKAIQKYLNEYFDKITICANKEFNKKLLNKYHTCHFFSWIERKKIAGKYKGLTAGVSSHNFQYLHPEKARKYLPKYGAITGNSQLIVKELKKRELNSTIYYTPNGVDETIFMPDKKKTNLDKFVIGWSGQPTMGGFNRESGLDMHGYTNILLPLMGSLKEYKDIHFEIMAKTHKNAVSFDRMPEFYHGLDLFIHTGFGTGTPNPLFEAQACGIPAISTAIGEAPQLIKDGENGYLVGRYFNKAEANQRVQEIKQRIVILRNDWERLLPMGENARKIIEELWTWKERAKAWLPVFQNHWKKI